MSFKVATFNANSIRARLDVVLAWIKAHRPDVLCIQETKVVDDLFPADVIEETGYHVVFRGEKAYNGVAIIARERPTQAGFGFGDGGPSDEARLISAKVGPIHIVNTYVPQGREIDHPMFQYKQEWFGRLRGYFDAHFTPRSRVIWTGDLNVAPEAIDIHNAEKQENHVCYHRSVREAFADTAAWGFVDVFRKHHPEAGHYSYFDYRTVNAVDRAMGWRIDLIMATKTLAARSIDAYIDLEPRRLPKPSDHTFVVAEFDI